MKILALIALIVAITLVGFIVPHLSLLGEIEVLKEKLDRHNEKIEWLYDKVDFLMW